MFFFIVTPYTILMLIFVHSCRGKYGKWTSEDMDLAVSAHRNGDMDLNAVERTCGISKSTIKRHMKRSNVT